MADRRVNVKLTADASDYIATLAKAAAATDALDKKVDEAEQRRNNALRSEAAASEQVRQAEQRLNKAKADTNATTKDVTKAERDLGRARATLADKTYDVEAAQRKLNDARSARDAFDTSAFIKGEQDRARAEADAAAKREALAVSRAEKRAKAEAAAEAKTLERETKNKVTPLFEDAGKDSAGSFKRSFGREFEQRRVFFGSILAGALAAGAPVALAGAAVLFGGIAAVAGAQSQEVRDAWSALGREISKGSLEDAKVFIPELEQAAKDLGKGFEDLRPQIREAFAATAPLVESVTRGVIGLAKNAMPGLVHAVQDAQPVMRGFQTFLEQTGSGLGGFFDNMARHSPAAGRDFGDLGRVLDSLLKVIGTLLGSGAELASVVLPPLAAILGVTANVVERLSGLLPGLVGGFAAMKAIGFVNDKLAQFAKAAPAAVQSLTGSAVAGEKVGKGLDAASRGVASLAKASGALPVVGMVVSVLADEYARATDDTNRWAHAILQGGQAAKDAKKEYDNSEPGGHWQYAIDEALGLKATWSDAKDAAVGLADSALGASSGVDTVTRSAADASRKLADVPGVYESAAGAIALVGRTGEMTETQMDTATQKIVDFRNEVQTIATSFVQPVTDYQRLLTAKSDAEQKAATATAKTTADSSDSWVDYAAKVDVTLSELATSLETDLTNQLNWRDNLVKIAGWAGADVAQYLTKMGKDGVDIVSKMADGTSAEAQRMAGDIRTAIQQGSTNWSADMQLGMAVMAEKAKEGATATSASVADALGVGLANVQKVAAEYGIVLANGINPLLVTLGHKAVGAGDFQTKTNWGTNSILPPGFKADGGIENHTAQIAGAGQWRVWAEPETGGEAYIPLAPSKRTRSVGIWKETGKRLGMDVQMFAFGGINDVPKPPASQYGPPISTGQDAALGAEYDAVVGYLKQFSGPMAGSGVQRWLPLVLSTLAIMGQPASLAQTVLRRMQMESGGNPRAINLWDINAQRGTPSKGLMQVIDPTFRAYHFGGTSWDPFDPEANLLASYNYAIRRYGSLSAAFNRPGGYASGGETPSGKPFWVGERGPELMWSSREAYVTSAAKSKEYAGAANLGGGSSSTNHTREVHISAVAAPNTEALANAIVDRQRDLEFLHG